MWNHRHRRDLWDWLDLFASVALGLVLVASIWWGVTHYWE